MAALLAGVTMFFIFKEAIPTARYYLSPHASLPEIERGRFPQFHLALERLSCRMSRPPPNALLSDSAEPIVYSLGRRSLVLSLPALHALDQSELEAVVAHELAHTSKQPLLVNMAALAGRFLTFYNPVSLLVFRRIQSDTEKHCDDIAVSITGNRIALASALLKVFGRGGGEPHASQARSRSMLLHMSSLESKACLDLTRERAARMLRPGREELRLATARLLVTGGLLAVLLFFVV